MVTFGCAWQAVLKRIVERASNREEVLNIIW